MTAVVPPTGPDDLGGADRPTERATAGRTRKWMVGAAIFAAGLILGIGLTTVVYSGGGAGSVPLEAPGPAAVAGPPVDQVGGTFRNGGATITVTSVREAATVEKNESGYRPGSGFEAFSDAPAGSGAKFVVVQTKVMNDSAGSFDLTCSLPVSTKLVDERGRQFDAVDGLYELRGNPECNDGLQPGFDTAMTWVYRVPADAAAAAWTFEDISDPSTIGSNAPTSVTVIPAR